MQSVAFRYTVVVMELHKMPQWPLRHKNLKTSPTVSYRAEVQAGTALARITEITIDQEDLIEIRGIDRKRTGE